MFNILSIVKKRLVWFVAVFMVLGIVNGMIFPGSYLKPFIIPLTILMVYPMMVSMNLKAIFTKCDFKLQGVTQLINFLIIPLLGFGLGQLFFADQPYTAFGLLLIAVLPTSGMTISWTGFAKGNTQVAVKMTIIGLILGTILTPFYGLLLMGKTVSIPLLKTIKQISLVVLIPLVLGLVTQLVLRRGFGEAKFNKDIKPNFPKISLIGVLGIIFVAMSLKAQDIIGNPMSVVQLVPALLLFYTVNYSMTSLIGRKFFSRENAVALVYGSVMRNLSVALAIAMTVFTEHGTEMALIISVAYILQIKSAAWYTKLANRIFGSARNEQVSDVMSRGVFSLPENSTLKDAIKLLDEENIHSVAVHGKNDTLTGVLNAEKVVNLLAKESDLNQQLNSVKLLPVEKCKPDTPLKEAVKNMRGRHNYKCIVMDENGKPAGVLTESDLLHRYAHRGEKQ